MLLTMLLPALLMGLSVTQAAVIDAPELTPPRGHIFPIGAVGESASPNVLNAREAGHLDCEYSGIFPGVWSTGKCKTGANYPKGTIAGAVGYCDSPSSSDVNGFICDIRWKGKAMDEKTFRACPGFEDSQFACKHDGDPCQIYHFADDPSLGIAHCQFPGTIIN